MTDLFAAQSAVLHPGPHKKKQVVQDKAVAACKPGMTTSEKVLISIILLSLASPVVLLARWKALLPFFLIVIQPVLIAAYAKKRQHRGVVWGLPALVINVAILISLEMHTAARSVADVLTEIIVAICMSTIVFGIISAARRDNPDRSEDFSLRLRRGLFRVWVLATIVWMIFIFIAYPLSNCYKYGFFATSFYSADLSAYFHLGIWLIGVPALAFVIGLSATWAVDGFRRGTPAASTEDTQINRRD
jgi:hypothetical protein